MKYKKIEKQEFDKLQELFPDNDDMWLKYKDKRLKQLDKKEIDVFVIEEKSIFIGEITVNYVSDELITETIYNRRVYLGAFRIQKQYQGLGFGQKLMNYVIHCLRDKGYTEFTIGVEESNEVAKHIYFKLGFTEEIDKGHGDEFDPSEYTLYLKDAKIDKSIENLMRECSLGEVLEIPQRVFGGAINRIYKVKTDKDAYAVKVLNSEIMKRENAFDNHRLAEKVANIAKKNGVKALTAKIINNKIIQKVDEMYFLIFDWFEGKAITSEEITIEKCQKVAKELAKLHKINFGDIKEECKYYEDSKEINWNFYLSKLEKTTLKNLLKYHIKRFSKLERNSIKALKEISNNIVISHRDIDLSNVLWNNDELVLIDWEATGMINPSMEVIDTAWNWSGGQNNFDRVKFKTFIETYIENGGNITDFEKAIEADFKAKFEWLEYNLKRVCGIECMDKEEQDLGEKEVIKTINEIKKFDDCSQIMKE